MVSLLFDLVPVSRHQKPQCQPCVTFTARSQGVPDIRLGRKDARRDLSTSLDARTKLKNGTTYGVSPRFVISPIL